MSYYKPYLLFAKTQEEEGGGGEPTGTPTLILRETFSSAAQTAPSALGFTVYADTTCTDVSSTSNGIRINANAGSQTYVPGGLYATGNVPGYLNISNTGGLLIAKSASGIFSTTGRALHQVTFWSGGGNAGITMRFAVKVDGQWYVSEDEETQSGSIGSSADFSEANPNAVQFDSLLDVQSNGRWRLLTVNPGVELSMAGSAIAGRIPNEPVQEYGIFAPISGGCRFDTLEIYALV